MSTIIEKAHGLGSISQGYGIGLATGIMAAGLAAGAEVFQFRWTSTTKLCLVRRVLVSAGNLGTAFTAGGVTFDMAVARAWTAAGTGGGAATLTTNNAKLNTTSDTTALGEARIATTAALGAGTKTLDAQALTSAFSAVPNVAGSVVMPPTDLWRASAQDEYPLLLAAEEGFVLRVTVPATGTWTGGVAMRWDEIKPY